VEGWLTVGAEECLSLQLLMMLPTPMTAARMMMQPQLLLFELMGLSSPIVVCTSKTFTVFTIKLQSDGEPVGWAY
jgi:hypothetical protein